MMSLASTLYISSLFISHGGKKIKANAIFMSWIGKYTHDEKKQSLLIRGPYCIILISTDIHPLQYTTFNYIISSSVALIPPLAWEPPHAAGRALKDKKKLSIQTMAYNVAFNLGEGESFFFPPVFLGPHLRHVEVPNLGV